ncbi:MAG: hypothetical protein ACT4N2_09540 [Hyphomicrobium sp.]
MRILVTVLALASALLSLLSAMMLHFGLYFSTVPIMLGGLASYIVTVLSIVAAVRLWRNPLGARVLLLAAAALAIVPAIVAAPIHIAIADNMQRHPYYHLGLHLFSIVLPAVGGLLLRRMGTATDDGQGSPS